MIEKTLNEQADITVIQDVDALFASRKPKPSELGEPLKRLQKEVTPLRKEYEELEAHKSDPELSDLDRDLLDIEMKDIEARMIPFTARIARIHDYVAELKDQKDMELNLARTEVEFSDRRRVEKDRDTLRSKVITLADRTRNGLSDTAAAQTRHRYVPVKNTFEEMLRSTDEEKARNHAAKVLGELKPVLLQKISGFEDIKTEMLDAFVETAKK